MGAGERKIIHVDMDAFYASVEQRDCPELRGKPLIVGGRPEGRGVVASCSYEARRFGIRSAISSAKAKRLCPAAIFVPPNFAKYKEASQRIREVFHEVTDRVEPLSLDEAYLDVTENKLGKPLAREIAVWVRTEIKRRTGLTASAGVGPNKFIAKVASDFRKPDGLVVVPPSLVLEFVRKLPVERLWGVGPATAKRLHALGLLTAEDIRNCSLERLDRELGKFGHFLYELSFGRDDRVVDGDWDPKSSGSESTFSKDVLDLEQLRAMLQSQVDELVDWLRKHERFARTVTLKVRYSDFRTITRSRTLPFPTDRADELEATAWILLTGSTDAGREPIRLIGVTLTGFVSREDPVQLWFEFERAKSDHPIGQ